MTAETKRKRWFAEHRDSSARLSHGSWGSGPCAGSERQALRQPPEITLGRAVFCFLGGERGEPGEGLLQQKEQGE